MTTGRRPPNFPPVVVTVAGGPLPGYIDGAPLDARFNEPCAVAVTRQGDYLVLEVGTERLRLIGSNGEVSTIGPYTCDRYFPSDDQTVFSVEVQWPPGGEACNSVGDHDKPKHAQPDVPIPRRIWEEPQGLTIGHRGEWVVADTGGDRIWAIDTEGAATWVAGAEHPTVVSDRSGVWLNEPEGRVDFDSIQAASKSQGFRDGDPRVARFNAPIGMAADSHGSLFVADSGNGLLRHIGADGQVETIRFGRTGRAGPGSTPSAAPPAMAPVGVVVSKDGTLLVSDKARHCLYRLLPGGALEVLAGDQPGFVDGVGTNARFREPMGIALDEFGGLWVADSGNHAIRYVFPDGLVVTVAGRGVPAMTDGPGDLAAFNCPCGVAIGLDGTVLVADRNNHLIRQIRSAVTVRGEVGADGLLYAVEADKGQQFAHPYAPTKLEAWANCVGREVRTVVRYYDDDRIQIYFKDAWIEVEGVGTIDPIPYFCADPVSREFHMVPTHLAGKRITGIAVGPENELAMGDGTDESFPYTEWVKFDFEEGSTEWLLSYLGEGIQIVTDSLASFHRYMRQFR